MMARRCFMATVVLMTSYIFANLAVAAVKVIVVPVPANTKITCKGTLNGTRWCDNGDGTVMDMTTGLVWLQDGHCWNSNKWIQTSTNYGAVTMAGKLKAPNCGLSDGSETGDWRLPTYDELQYLTGGDEKVRDYSPRAFINVQSAYYWSITTHFTENDSAGAVSLANGLSGFSMKTTGNHYILAVRQRK